MRNLGYALIWIGFLAGAMSTVIQEEGVEWTYLIPSVIVGIVGIVLVRQSQRRLAESDEQVSANIQNIEDSLQRIIENIKKLNAEEKATMNPYDARHRIDELFIDDLNIFVESRESISHAYGLQTYADVMSHYAAAERYLNRVWSASADGYIDEVNQYLDRAEEQFIESQKILENAKNTG